LADDSERQRKAIAGLEDQLEDRARWLQVQGDQIEALAEALTSVQAQLDERTQWLQIQSESIDMLHKELGTIKEPSPNPVKTTKD
jgi:chromosome segregation ATPase